MALKLAGQDDNPNENSGQEQQVQNDTPAANPWDVPNKTSTYTDYNSPYNSMDPVISNTVIKNNDGGDGKNIIVFVSGIILYVVIGLAVLALAWMSVAGKPIDIYANVMKAKPLFSLVSMVAVIDAILVFALHEKRASLLIVAFLFQPFYPIRRNKVINGSGGTGVLVTLAYIVGIIAMGATIFSAVSKYGNVVAIGDQSVRTGVAAMMDHTMDNGSTYGQFIMKYMSVDNAAIEEQNGHTLIALTGKGTVTLADDGVFQVGGASVDTAYVFSREVTGDYNIVSVQLGDKTVTGKNAVAYWNSLKAY